MIDEKMLFFIYIIHVFVGVVIIANDNLSKVEKGEGHILIGVSQLLLLMILRPNYALYIYTIVVLISLVQGFKIIKFGKVIIIKRMMLMIWCALIFTPYLYLKI